MRKIILLIVIAFILILPSCAKQTTSSPLPATNNAGTQAIDSPASSDEPLHGVLPPIDHTGSDLVEIREKLFIAQINDIYLNAEDYLGKTIKYEGIFDSFTWEETGDIYYYVIRYGPGCCGTDGNAGFEIAWEGENPALNDWVEVIGVLELYEEDGRQYLRINVSSLTVLTTRGAEYVSQ